MTPYNGHDFSDYDWRYWAEYRRKEAERQAEREKQAERNRCTCIRRPGDDIRCPVHGGKK